MSKQDSELERLTKRVSVIESQVLATVKIMAREMCNLYVNVIKIQLKGEEREQFAKLWFDRCKEVVKEIGKADSIVAVATIRDRFVKDIGEYLKATKVDTADKAMEIAHNFIKKYSPVALPLKAAKAGTIWTVDIDTGPIAVKIAQVKVDAKTGDILSYDIPEKK